MEPMQYCTIQNNPNMVCMNDIKHLFYLPERKIAFHYITPNKDFGNKPSRIEASVEEIFDPNKIIEEINAPVISCSEIKQVQIPTDLADRIKKIVYDKLALKEKGKSMDQDAMAAALMNMMSQAPKGGNVSQEEAHKIWEAFLPKSFADSVKEIEKLENLAVELAAEFKKYATTCNIRV